MMRSRGDRKAPRVIKTTTTKTIHNVWVKLVVKCFECFALYAFIVLLYISIAIQFYVTLNFLSGVVVFTTAIPPREREIEG